MLWASTEDTVLRSVLVPADTAAGLPWRARLAQVSLRTGSAGGGMFSLPNRRMAVACGGTTTDGVVIVGADELAATDVARVDCRAWPKQVECVVGLWRLVVDRNRRLTPEVSLVPIPSRRGSSRG